MSPKKSYHPGSKALHWGIGLAWLATWSLGIYSSSMPQGWNPEYIAATWHKAIGSLILCLLVVRIAWRLCHPVPDLPASIGAATRRAAKLGHLSLHAFAMLALPLSGWFMSSVAGAPVVVAGLFKLPALTDPMPEFRHTAQAIHQLIAWSMGVLVAGHILMALKHHFFDRDDILRRMLPRRTSVHDEVRH